MKSILLFFSIAFTIPSQAQITTWFKFSDGDSVMQVQPFISVIDRDDYFNKSFWEEGSRSRFDFPVATSQLKNGLYRSWTTHRELLFTDKTGNPIEDSVIWAEGQIHNFKRDGLWKKYHHNGNVKLERHYCNGIPCGEIRVYYKNGQLNSAGFVDNNGYPDGLWKGFFESGKLKWEINFEHGITKGWSSHYVEEGLFSRVHFTGKLQANNFDELLLFYPKSGQSKAICSFENQQARITQAWNETGQQVVANGDGYIQGNFPIFDEFCLESSVKNGYLTDPSKRYFDNDCSKLRLEGVEDGNNPAISHRKTFNQSGLLLSSYSIHWGNVDRYSRPRQHGKSEHYYDNEIKSHEFYYDMGELVGTNKVWNEKGTLIYEYQFTESRDTSGYKRSIVDDLVLSAEGVPNGFWKTYNDQGVLMKQESFKNGLRDGLWRTWYANGKLKSEQKFKDDQPIGETTNYAEDGKRLKHVEEPCPTQNWGSNFQCTEHQGQSVIDNIGTCKNCGQGTSSGMFSLCAKCACELKKCQRCGRDL
jgi:uncharacterized protein